MALYGIKDNKSFDEIYSKAEINNNYYNKQEADGRFYTQSEVDQLIAYYGLKTRLTYRDHCLYDAVNNIAGEFESLDAIHEAVSNGDFSNIYVGDYIMVKISCTTSGYSLTDEIVKLIVADYNYYPSLDGSSNFMNHLVLMPEDCFSVTNYMHAGVRTNGGYISSTYYNIANIIGQAFDSALNDHLYATSIKSSSSGNNNAINNTGGNNTGASNDLSWTARLTWLMSEFQVFGTMVFGQGFDAGSNAQQLAYFILKPGAVRARKGRNGDYTIYWLSTIADQNRYSVVSNFGIPDYDLADSNRGYRPIMTFI